MKKQGLLPSRLNLAFSTGAKIEASMTHRSSTTSKAKSSEASEVTRKTAFIWNFCTQVNCKSTSWRYFLPMLSTK